MGVGVGVGVGVSVSVSVRTEHTPALDHGASSQLKVCSDVYLIGNQLTGSIPESIGNLLNLR